MPTWKAYDVKAKKKSGKIAFHDPKDVKVMYHPPIKEHNEISCEEVKIEPEEGKLLSQAVYPFIIGDVIKVIIASLLTVGIFKSKLKNFLK